MKFSTLNIKEAGEILYVQVLYLVRKIEDFLRHILYVCHGNYLANPVWVQFIYKFVHTLLVFSCYNQIKFRQLQYCKMFGYTEWSMKSGRIWGTEM
jgi:hypothetical protein